MNTKAVKIAIDELLEVATIRHEELLKRAETKKNIPKHARYENEFFLVNPRIQDLYEKLNLHKEKEQTELRKLIHFEKFETSREGKQYVFMVSVSSYGMFVFKVL